MAKLHRIRSLRRILASSSGFTLLEVLLAVSIVSIAVGVVGGGIFQVRVLQQSWVDDAVATKNLRHAGSLFAEDALNAEDALDAPGGSRLPQDCANPPASPADAVTLTWDDAGGVSRQAVYSAAGGVLSRLDEGGNTWAIIASGVVDGSVKFSLCGSLLTLELQVDAEEGTTETMTLRTYLRKLQ